MCKGVERNKEVCCSLLDLNIPPSLWHWTKKQANTQVHREKKRDFSPTQNGKTISRLRSLQTPRFFLLVAPLSVPDLDRSIGTFKATSCLWRWIVFMFKLKHVLYFPLNTFYPLLTTLLFSTLPPLKWTITTFPLCHNSDWMYFVSHKSRKISGVESWVQCGWMRRRRLPKTTACSCAATIPCNKHTRESTMKSKTRLTIYWICETLSTKASPNWIHRNAQLQFGSHSSLAAGLSVFLTIFESLGTWLKSLPSELHHTAPKGCLLLLTHPSPCPI